MAPDVLRGPMVPPESATCSGVGPGWPVRRAWSEPRHQPDQAATTSFAVQTRSKPSGTSVASRVTSTVRVVFGSAPGTTAAARSRSSRTRRSTRPLRHVIVPTKCTREATGARSVPTRSTSGSNRRFHHPPTWRASGHGRSARSSEARTSGSTARPRHAGHRSANTSKAASGGGAAAGQPFEVAIGTGDPAVDAQPEEHGGTEGLLRRSHRPDRLSSRRPS